MAGFKRTLAAMPAGSSRRAYGTAYFDGTEWFAVIDGSPITAHWTDPFQPQQGGNIAVDITAEGRGQHSALVICGYSNQPRPSTGVVDTVGVLDLTVTGEFGGTFTTDRFIGSYTPGAAVYLMWDAGKPTVIGAIPTTAPPAPAPAPVAPTAGAVADTLRTPATASDTYGVGGWGRWATSQRGGEDVYTGTWGGNVVTGSFFYGASNTVLQGKTIDQARFRVPKRLGVGASGPATVYLYAHNSQARPGGDVTRVAGPHTITVQQGQDPHIEVLPASFHPILAAGGGLSIAGGPYVGFQGRLSTYQDRQDPDAGKLEFDWHR